MKIKTFGFAKVAPPADADVVFDCRRVGIASHRDPKAKEIVDRALDYAERHPDATIAFGCMYGEERSVAIANYVGRVLGVEPVHTTRYMPKGTFAEDSAEAKMAAFMDRWG